MNSKRTLNLRLAAGAVLAGLFQVIGLLRYVERLPEDWVGIALYLASIVAFALVALGFYLQHRRM